MKKDIKIFITLLLSAFITAGCGSTETPHKEAHEEEHTGTIILPVKSAEQIGLKSEKVKFQPLTGYLTIPAKVITNQDNEATVGSLVQGRVHRVFAKTGDYVRAGQVLMTVEGLEIGEIKAGYLIAKAALNYAKENYERNKKLFEQKIGSQKSLLESQAEYEKALAGYKAEDKKIHSVGLTDEDVNGNNENDEHTSGTLPVKSPINGIVSERNVVTGQFVDAAVNAFKIINTGSVWIDGQVYEKDIPKITGKTGAVFISSVYQGEVYKGNIIHIGQVVDGQTRTVTVRGEYSNPGGKLKPQMFGELKIPVGSGAKAIMINEEAVVKDPELPYLFVQVNDTSFIKRNVVTGLSDGGLVEIKEGLNEGETVVVKGVFYLRSELEKEELEGDEH